jgi:hypothetical protein
MKLFVKKRNNREEKIKEKIERLYYSYQGVY